MFHYTECAGSLRTASGSTIPIVGHGDLLVAFPSANNDGEVEVLLKNVAHVPLIKIDLISTSTLALDGHTHQGGLGGLELDVDGGGQVYFPYVGKLPVQTGRRVDSDSRQLACAVIAPGKAKATHAPLDINDYHCS
ncbi:unnamed protein product, partial [Pylaiella littoralis]